jgi:hypothetical protein
MNFIVHNLEHFQANFADLMQGMNSIFIVKTVKVSCSQRTAYHACIITFSSLQHSFGIALSKSEHCKVELKYLNTHVMYY